MSKTSKENFYSYHVFLFPFKWEYKDNNNTKETLDEQLDISKFCTILEKASEWKSNIMSNPPETIPLYNEMSYFHDFARKAIYDFGDEDSSFRHFEYKLDQTQNKYIIELKDKSYSLDLDDILLNVYNTGVGVLSFHLFNREEEQSSPQDILNINQYGRRIFPPFLQNKEEEIGSPAFFRHNNFIGAAEQVKGKEIAHKISLQIGNRLIEEDYAPENNPMKIGQLPKFIKDLFSTDSFPTDSFPTDFFDTVRLEHTIDDRMFVLSWYGNKDLPQQLNQKIKDSFVSDKLFYAYKTDPWWYKYVFVDGNDKMTCQDEEMVFDALSKHSNPRWVGYGTLFGVSRYSFVSVTSPLSKFNLVATHTMSMYYKLVELTLIQRACILRFSDEVADISKLEPSEKKKDRKRLTDKVNSLYRQYIRFVNKVYFREVTAQDQGIELYDLLQQHMRIERDVKDLDAEIQELYQYAMMIEEKRRNDAIEIITVLGALLIVPAFIVGYMGMNIEHADYKNSLDLSHRYIIAACTTSALSIIAFFYSSKKWQKILCIFLFLITISLVLFYPEFAKIILKND